MNKHTSPPALAIIALLAGLALLAAGCVTPVQAAGSPTPWWNPPPTATGTPVPPPTPQPTPTPTNLPQPVCAIEWTWRDAGLTITAVDFSRLDGLAPGDLILAINGRDAETVILEIEASLGGIGDPALRRALALDAILYGSDVLTLLVRHGQAPAYYYNLQPDCKV